MSSRTSVLVPHTVVVPAPVSGVASSSSRPWKKDFGSSDFAVAMVLGTAFVFLTAVDYSIDAYILGHVTPASCTPTNPFVVTLATYYEWRSGGSPVLKYWDGLMMLLLPLFFYAVVKDNFDTVRGLRAPIGRHLLDAECLVQLLAVVTIVSAKAAPTQERFIQAVRQATQPDKPDVALFADLTQLHSFHFLIFALNALQWFVPLLRLVMQQKQETMRTREMALAESKAELEKRALERANARAQKAAIPSEKEMLERMTRAEAVATGKESNDTEPADGQQEITDGKPEAEVRKRK